jgi:hypothetical protein
MYVMIHKKEFNLLNTALHQVLWEPATSDS